MRGKWGLFEMLQHELERYAQAYYRVFGALTALDAMCQEFAPPEVVTQADMGRADELSDLAVRIECLTACWVSAGVGEEAGTFWR